MLRLAYLLLYSSKRWASLWEKVPNVLVRFKFKPRNGVCGVSAKVYLADGACADPVTDGDEVVRVPHILGLLGLHLHYAITVLAANLPP